MNMLKVRTIPRPAPSADVEDAFEFSYKHIDTVLAPYYSKAKYVQSATITGDVPTEGSNSKLVVRGKLSVPSSCYIQSTGHFNAVEFFIISNQLGYLAQAWAMKSGAFAKILPGEKLADFRNKQLGDMLLLSVDAKFLKMIDASDFYGEAQWYDTRHNEESGLLILEWLATYYDNKGGRATGHVTSAIRL